MAANLISVDSVVNDYMLTQQGDDYGSNVPEVIIRNYALRGARDLNKDIQKRVRSLQLPVNQSLYTVDLPDDFLSFIKIGVVDNYGMVKVFSRNQRIDIKQAYSYLADGVTPKDSNGDGLYDRVNARDVGDSSLSTNEELYVFSNFRHSGSFGQLFGVGGDSSPGQYRINYDENRIELTSTDAETVVIEYIADEAKSTCPSVNVLCEESLRAYIYWQIVQRSKYVHRGEKMDAKGEYFRQKRIANASMNALTKQDLMNFAQKNYMQAPKF